MRSTAHKPILVTGSHRSGTTWVGEMIASHPRVVYVWEPFNFEHRPAHAPMRSWFEHVTPEREAEYREYLRPQLEYSYPWWREITERPTPRRFAGATLRTAKAWLRWGLGCRPLMKDPIAIFSTEWLARTYDMDVIVMIRHPAAFVSSLKRLNWRFKFKNFVCQPALLDGLLRPLANDIIAYHETEHDLIDEGILFWRAFHHVIRGYQERHPGWIYLRHEDISLRPIEEFTALFQYLGLDMSDRTRRKIQTHSSDDNPAEAGEKVVHQLKRDSKANIWNWQKRLTPDEVLRIRRGTEDIAYHFYSDADWGGCAVAA